MDPVEHLMYVLATADGMVVIAQTANVHMAYHGLSHHNLLCRTTAPPAQSSSTHQERTPTLFLTLPPPTLTYTPRSAPLTSTLCAHLVVSAIPPLENANALMVTVERDADDRNAPTTVVEMGDVSPTGPSPRILAMLTTTTRCGINLRPSSARVTEVSPAMTVQSVFARLETTQPRNVVRTLPQTSSLSAFRLPPENSSPSGSPICSEESLRLAQSIHLSAHKEMLAVKSSTLSWSFPTSLFQTLRLIS